MIHKHGQVFRLSFYANHYPEPVFSVALSRLDLRGLAGICAHEVCDTIMLHSSENNERKLDAETTKS
jgi:hypothetical protein